MPKYSKLKCIRDIYPGRIDMTIYQIYQLEAGFLAKFVSSPISQNIFFHMIGKKSFHFIFWEGGGGGGGAFPKLVYTFNLDMNKSFTVHSMYPALNHVYYLFHV